MTELLIPPRPHLRPYNLSPEYMNWVLQTGYNRVEEFWRKVLPTRWQAAKLKRDPSTPVIDKEWVLVFTRVTP